jgi:heme/copper-type cytochrome/quinol oxidase subunit 2
MSRFAPWLVLAFAWLAIAALPESASACSVCYAGAEESRKAFLLTTVLLSVIPLAMIGALAWWVWRHARDAERADPR